MRKHRRNITIINNKIDYDKLAEAIVNAQRKVEEPIEEKVTNVKISPKLFLKNIWYIIINKKSTNGELTIGVFSLITSFIFKFVSCIGFLLAVSMVGLTVYEFFRLDWTGISFFKNIMTILLVVSTAIIIFMYSVMMLGASREVEKEKDRNYTIALFSGVVSFVALVVAGIDLFKR